MSFESFPSEPASVPDPEAESGQEEVKKIEKSKRGGFLRKIALSGALMMGAAGAVGCDSKESHAEKSSPNQGTKHVDTNRVERGTESPLMQDYRKKSELSRETSRKVLENQKNIFEGKLNLDTNEFLSIYHKTIEKGYVDDSVKEMFSEGQQMRVLQIALKKGFIIPRIQDGKQSLRMNINTEGHVPVSAEINGQIIHITDADLTQKEIKLRNSARNLRGGLHEENPQGASKKVTPGVLRGIDMDDDTFKSKEKPNVSGTRQGHDFDDPKNW